MHLQWNAKKSYPPECANSTAIRRTTKSKTKIENHLVFNRNFSSPSHYVGVKLTAFYLRFGDIKLIKKIKLENGDFQYLHPDQQLVCGHHKKIDNLLVNTRLVAPAG